MRAGRATWWMFSALSVNQPLCAVRGSSLAVLNTSVYGSTLRGGCYYCNNCALCLQLKNKRRLFHFLLTDRRYIISNVEIDDHISKNLFRRVQVTAWYWCRKRAQERITDLQRMKATARLAQPAHLLASSVG